METITNIQDLRSQLEAAEAEFATLAFDNNGNAVDREYTDKVWAQIEELQTKLFGHPL